VSKPTVLLDLDHGNATFTTTGDDFHVSGWNEWKVGTYTPRDSTLYLDIRISEHGKDDWFGMDDIAVRSEWELEMIKRLEIHEAMLTRARSVLTGNGYALSIGEVIGRKVRVPDFAAGWPHVQITRGDEERERFTLGRTKGVLSVDVGIFCKSDGVTDPGDQCEIALGELYKALQLGPNDTTNQGTVVHDWLGLSYVTNVFFKNIRPEELTDETARDVRLLVVTIEVLYVFDNRNP
jgi:hypothetical protein